MRRNLIILLLVIACTFLANRVSILESYRHANSLGWCSEFSTQLKDAVARETCLREKDPRKVWFENLFYGLIDGNPQLLQPEPN